MRVKLNKYSNRDTYEKDFPDGIEEFGTVNKAIDFARKKLAKVRNTNKFLGYKMFNKHGELLHKLPSN